MHFNTLFISFQMSLVNSAAAQNNSMLNGMRTPTGCKPSADGGKPKASDMEDYCEICQKHFCNKYYLKKHKQDVHGIIPDNPSNKRSRTTPVSPSTIPSSTPTSLAASMNTMPNVMFLNPFVPMLQNQPMLQAVAAQAAQAGGFPQGLTGLPPMPPMPPIPQNIPSPPQNNDQTPTSKSQPILEHGQKPPTSSSPNGSIPNDALRSMGVLNADAYCELCRKEFCNKYFLKIHKANKHGIYIDEPGLRGLPFGLPGMPPGFEGMPPGFDNMPQLAQLMMPGADGSALTPSDLSKMFSGELGALAPPHESFPMPPLPPRMCESPDDKHRIPKIEKTEPNEEFICRTCSKEFASAYSLKVHMINVHQVKPQEPNSRSNSTASALDEIIKPQLTPESLGLKVDPFHGLTPMNESNNPSNTGGTMFSNMITAKLADRVTCDICNKEVCNKYFLKTHKLKVHNIGPDGIVSNKDEKTVEKLLSHSPNKSSLNIPMLSSSPMKPTMDLLPPHQQPNIPSHGDVAKPNNDELLKMGIDPEAYCEICKKEFCSKYFLKTHKLNIHGIKVNNAEGRGMSGLSMLGNMPNGLSHPSMSIPGMEMGMPPVSLSQMPPSSSSIMPNMSVSSPLLSVPNPASILSGPSPLPSALAFMAGSNQPHDQQLMGEEWRWKEPMNSQGVMCEICNKEICNKFFLKMHMLHKHGVVWNEGEGEETRKRKLGSAGNSLSSSPTQDDIPCDLSKSGPRGSRKSEDREIEHSHSGSKVLAKTWHVPQEYHPEPKPYHEEEKRCHVEEHQCSVCHASFSEVIKMQMHILQEHPGVVPTLSASSPPIGTTSPPIKTTNTPHESTPTERHTDTQAITQALRRKYHQSLKRKQTTIKRWKKTHGSIGDRVKSALVNHLNKQQDGPRRKFRCAHCKERFLSRGLCQSHIRSQHPQRCRNKQLSTVNNNKPLYAKPCPDITESRQDIVMQAFTLRETSTDNTVEQDMSKHCFANSIVCLPVYQRIPEPITVSFTLTPTPAAV